MKSITSKIKKSKGDNKNDFTKKENRDKSPYRLRFRLKDEFVYPNARNPVVQYAYNTKPPGVALHKLQEMIRNFDQHKLDMRGNNIPQIYDNQNFDKDGRPTLILAWQDGQWHDV